VNRAVTEALAVATGAEQRHDPVTSGTGGPAGNADITAWTGLVLLVLFIAETATLLSLSSLISWHIVIGVLLVPLALLKTATTGWRIVRYYTGNAHYREAGPPPLILRVLGPLVVLTALAVLGSGLALIALGDGSRHTIVTIAGSGVDAVTLHKATFIAWLAVTGAHTLIRLVPAIQLVARVGPVPANVPGRSRRFVVLAATVVTGVVLGFVVLHLSGAWTGGGLLHDHHKRHDRASAAPATSQPLSAETSVPRRHQ
jgi:hypothetical protein